MIVTWLSGQLPKALRYPWHWVSFLGQVTGWHLHECQKALHWVQRHGTHPSTIPDWSKAHIPVNNKLQNHFGHARLLPPDLFDRFLPDHNLIVGVPVLFTPTLLTCCHLTDVAEWSCFVVCLQSQKWCISCYWPLEMGWNEIDDTLLVTVRYLWLNYALNLQDASPLLRLVPNDTFVFSKVWQRIIRCII